MMLACQRSPNLPLQLALRLSPFLYKTLTRSNINDPPFQKKKTNDHNLHFGKRLDIKVKAHDTASPDLSWLKEQTNKQALC